MTVILPPQQKTESPQAQFAGVTNIPQQRAIEAKDERDERLALGIVEQVVKHYSGREITDTQLVNACERVWRWVTGSTHPLPEDNKSGG